MRPLLFWGLIGALCVVGYAAQGWRGVVLVVTITVFWILFQFSRLTRAMRRLAERPLGVVPNAVMFNAQLSQGMQLMQVLKLTDSLGRAVDARPAGSKAEPERFVWTDPAGDSVRVDLRDGRVQVWVLQRAGAEVTT